MNVNNVLSSISKIPGAQIKEGAFKTVAKFQTKSGKNIEAVFNKAGEMIKRVVRNSDGDILTTMVKKNLSKAAGKNPMHPFSKISITKDGSGKILKTLRTFADKKGFFLTNYDKGKITNFVKTFKISDEGDFVTDTKVVDHLQKTIQTIKVKHFDPLIQKAKTFTYRDPQRYFSAKASADNNAIWGFDKWKDINKDKFMDFAEKILPKRFFAKPPNVRYSSFNDAEIARRIIAKPYAFKTGAERIATFLAKK